MRTFPLSHGSPMRWIVRPEDGLTLRSVLVRSGADPDAVRNGRVFVGRRRARRADEPVRIGDIVSIAPEPTVPAQPRVLARTNDLIAVDKPAGVPTIGDHSGSSHALVDLVAKAVGLAAARLHPTSRLDRDVSGVVVFATSKDAARRLALARTQGMYVRRYVAIAERAPRPESGLWQAAIGRSRDPRLRSVNGRDAVAAATRYAVCGLAPRGAAMLAVAPVTGRTHQIRVHAAHAGAPLVGDRAYGGRARVALANGCVIEPRRIALHAARVVVPDALGAALVAVAPVPKQLADLWSALGGDSSAWELSTSCVLASA